MHARLKTTRTLTALAAVALGLLSTATVTPAGAQDMSNGANNFYASEQVTVHKVIFLN